ncbi:Branched-chain amino acid transport system / permease component [Neomoorella glycerini]|uniref:Branched-chain amino acid transport system / permease component n=1 Tax=Neomoorella glycerini TaxID=55779 RepID=A0A6I5ZRE6_9FIRM|nr:ABC transporter permease [Moorella glycerini]QGP92583.1 Branched-chain amino acid transport system / permease component [Moorella glycerini]
MSETYLNFAFIITVLQAAIRMSTPLIWATMGGIFSEKAGVLSIGMEGILLVGAFGGFIGAFYTGNLLLGVLIAMLAGGITAAIYGYLTVKIGGSQAVVGTALVLFAAGITGFLYRAIFGVSSNLTNVGMFSDLKIPVLSRIPYIGSILFEQNVLVYLGFMVVLITWFTLYRTAWGLEIRSIGEHPEAADTVGLNVNLYRNICVLISGLLGGIGGAYLSLANANTFVEMMSAEKGYMAFAIIILGKYNPLGALLGCLLFGFADALQLRLQASGINIPFQFLLMLPYVLTLGVTASAGRAEKPAALARPYKKN